MNQTFISDAYKFLLMSEIKFIVRPRKRLKIIRVPQKLLELYKPDAEYYEVTVKPLVHLLMATTKKPEEPKKKHAKEKPKKQEKPEEEEEEFW